MAHGYVAKDDVTLAWLDNRDQVKLDIRKVVRRLENGVLDSLSQEFTAALNRGELLELRPAEIELAKMLRAQADRLVLETEASDGPDSE